MKKILIPAAAALAVVAGTQQARAQAFKTSPTGLQYLIARDVPGTQKPVAGDYVEIHIHSHVGDSVLFDSRKINDNKPVPFQLTQPGFKGDLVEGFMMMSAGDSAVFRVPLDSVLKQGNQPLPWMKPGSGQMLQYEVNMVKVSTQEQLKKEQEAKATKQKVVDEKALLDYFKKNKITAAKTPSGLYYKISSPGAGEAAANGKTVTVNYTGRTMDGNPFDSNVDPKFNHVQPFSFVLGQGQVIKGWDEGLALLKKGGKATLYIPSTLAYGERSPSPAIPANSVLIFDVEVTDVK